MPKVSMSDEGFRLAGEVLDEWYDDLRQPKYICLFQDTVIKKGGEPKAATIKPVKAETDEGFGWNQATKNFGGDEPQDFYKIKISKPIWDRLTPDQKKYVIDHEWSHAVRDENMKLKSKGHDIEENFVVMKRWPLNIMEDVYKMARIVEDKLKRGEKLEPPQNSFDFDAVALLSSKADGDGEEHFDDDDDRVF